MPSVVQQMLLGTPGVVTHGDANTLVLLAFNSGGSLGGSIVDYGTAGLTGYTLGGTADINSGTQKFGAGALQLDSPGHSGNSYLNHANDVAFRLGSGDFTVDFWAYSSGWSGVDLSGLASGVAGDWAIAETGGNIVFNNVGGIGTIVTITNPSTSTWHHFAFCRNSGTLTAYLNGTSASSVANATDFNNSAAAFRVGAVPVFNASSNCFIDEFRISDIARYSGNFTPPSSPY